MKRTAMGPPDREEIQGSVRNPTLPPAPTWAKLPVTVVKQLASLGSGTWPTVSVLSSHRSTRSPSLIGGRHGRTVPGAAGSNVAVIVPRGRRTVRRAPSRADPGRVGLAGPSEPVGGPAAGSAAEPPGNGRGADGGDAHGDMIRFCPLSSPSVGSSTWCSERQRRHQPGGVADATRGAAAVSHHRSAG
jgi:hypothetical protein